MESVNFRKVLFALPGIGADGRPSWLIVVLHLQKGKGLRRLTSKLTFSRLHREDNTCVDMEFLTTRRSKRMRCQVKHERRNSISTSSHVLFCLLYKLTNDDFWTIFPRFPNAKSSPKARQSFLNIFRKLPKISEDNRRFPTKKQ